MKKKRSKRGIRKKKENFSLKQEYNSCFNFIKDSRNFIYAAILIFFIFTALGFFFEDIINSFFRTYLSTDLNAQLLNYISDLLHKTEGMDHKQLMGFIFVNNLQSSFFGMVLGVLFGIFPFIAIISNGYILGFVAMLSVKAQGVGILWRILPHGIFELPAVFISLGLGLKLGMFIFQKNKIKTLKDNFWNSLRVFLLIVIPLLILASIIEGTLISLAR